MAIHMRNTLAKVELEALTANTPKALSWSESDAHSVLVMQASAATTLTVKGGNGMQGGGDLVLSLPQGVSCVKLDSGRFKDVNGTNKGKIVVVSAGTPSVGVIALV